jgi:hypothetical protein
MVTGINGRQHLPRSIAFDPYSLGYSTGIGTSNDVFSSLAEGPPAKEARYDPKQNEGHSIWNFPEAKVGKAAVLPATVEDYMVTAQYDFYTTRILPWRVTPDIYFQFEQFENPAVFLEVTPEQASSRRFAQKRQIFRRTMVRRAISWEFEQGFIKDQYGRSVFIMAMGVIIRAVQETANVEVMRALLGCHASTQSNLRKYGVIRDGELDEYHDRIAHQFMCVQKDERGLQDLATRVAKDQVYWGGQANAWILGVEVMNYIKVYPLYTEFWKGGPQAVSYLNGERVNPAPAGGTMDMDMTSTAPTGFLQDTPVFIARTQFADRSSNQVDIMSKVTEIGVYNLMVDRHYDNNTYTRRCRNIRVYDNDLDDWEEVGFDQAIENCLLFDKDDRGSLIDVWKEPQIARSIQDPDNDPFSMPNYDAAGTRTSSRTNIEYFGDMNPTWVTTQNFLDAGETLLNATANRDPATKQSFIDVIKTIISYRDVAAGTLAGFDTLTDEQKAILSDLSGKIKAIVGADNLLFKKAQADIVAENATRTTGGGAVLNADELLAYNVFYRNFATVGLVPAVLRNAGMASSIAQAPSVTPDQAISNFLLNDVGKQILNNKDSALSRIASDAAKTMDQRLSSIRDLILKTREHEPELVKLPFPTVELLDETLAKRVEKFMPTLKRIEAESTRAQAAPVATDKPQRIMIPAGSQPPAGYQLLNPGMPNFMAAGMPVFAPGTDRIMPNVNRSKEDAALSVAPGVSVGTLKNTNDASLANAGKTRAEIDAINARFGPNGRFRQLGIHIENILKSPATPAVKYMAVIYATTDFCKRSLRNLHAAGVRVLVNAALFRPHATYRTRYAIKFALDGKTGFTAIGNSSVQTETEAARMVGLVHYVTYLSAIVTQPKNVVVLDNIFCDRYLGGMGTEFWSSAAEYRAANNRRNSRSFLCHLLPYNVTRFAGPKVDWRGRWYTDQRMKLINQDRFNIPLFPGAGRLCQLTGVTEVHKREMTYARNETKRNYVCWQGVTWHWNAKMEMWDTPITEKGNMGERVYPSCGRVRNGHNEVLKVPAYVQ